MIKFDEIQPDLVPILKENGIEEKDLFNHSSDLYVGCANHIIAHKIMSGGPWNALSSTFNPQEGSDMDHYPVAVDIAFGYLSGFYKDKG